MVFGKSARHGRRHPGANRDRRRERRVVSTPSIALRVAVIVGIAVVAFGVVLFRLWFLQVLGGQEFRRLSDDNRLRSVRLVAARGVILDRSGTILVANRPGLAIGIRPMDVPEGQLAAIVGRLAPVLHMTPAAVKVQLHNNSGQVYDVAVIKRDVSKAAVSYILEHQLSLPGVEVQSDYLRAYPQGDLAAQVLGYLGEISGAQLKQQKFHGNTPGDVIGESGVEYAYDRWLRGRDGKTRIEVDSMGRPRHPGQLAGGQLPKPGDNLVLSIDSEVQKAAQRALRYGIEIAHQNGNGRANGGAAVALDARTGEVIAMASYPAYDPSIWSGGISQKNYRQLSRPAANYPLINKADAGLYPPGSTFKAVGSIAALEQGVIAPWTTLNAPGSYTNHGQVFNDWNSAGHGAVDLTQALVQSADTYFYQVGHMFYLRKGTELEDWATRLGYGHVAGIDIPGEAPGRVPTPQWRQRYYKSAVDKLWKPGNSIQLAIGQDDLLATPLQVAVNYAAIANGGYILTPHLGVKVVAADGSLVARFKSRQPRKINISSGTLDVVRNALRLAASTPQGTSYSVFGDYPVAVGGKTGTAEVTGKGDYAWYASFAPAGDPRYVVVVMIEQGGHGGTAAAPAARMIYDTLFKKHTMKVDGAVTSD
jgi:penicillin-binding protein 2